MYGMDPVIRDKILDFVSRETFDKLIVFESLFKKWQSRINLTCSSTLADFWKRHVLDSLQLLPIVKDKVGIDVGTGGGFPGLVLGLTGMVDVSCVECDLRKAAFLNEVCRVVGVNCKIYCDREEYLDFCGFDFVSCRALTKMTSLLDILCRRGKKGVFLKGRGVEKEIKEASEFFSFEYDIIPSVTADDGVIVVVKECRAR